MRSAVATILLAAMLAVGLAPAADAAVAAPRLSSLSSGAFPDRAYVLALPDRRALATGEVSVLENDEPVADATLVPADRLGVRGFSTVLAIDASESMRGEPIAAAMRAARAFAARRPDGQALGVVLFNGAATTTLPLTTDQSRIEAALARTPELRLGTVIRDATRTAVRMLRADRVRHGSVIVLSDGSDRGSRADQAAVLREARAAGVRVYGVGLESGEYDTATLKALAAGTGGAYTAASSSDRLERIFGQLATELSNQYVLRYRSLVGPRERVQVRVGVSGYDLPAIAAYTSPALPGQPVAPYTRTALEAFLRSPLAILLIALMCAGLIAGGVLVLLRHRGGGVLERVGRFVPRLVNDAQLDADLQDARPQRERKSMLGSRWVERVRQDLDVAKIELPVERLLAMVGAATALGMWVFVAVSGTTGAALLGLTIPLAARTVVNLKAGRERRAFGDQLPDNIQIVASAMRSGQSFVQALSILVTEAAEPSKAEFARVVHDERLGMSIEEALTKVADRMRSEELQYVGLVARLQSETGGNTADVLDRLVETLRARAELRRLVRTLTSQGRLASYIIGALPLVILAALTVLNRDYANQLFETSAGHTMLGISAVLIALGGYALRRIVDIKV